MRGAQIILGILGLSAGMGTAAGLFSFIIGLGVVSDLADRTHTGEHVLLYESSVALGGILGSLIFVYRIPVPGGPWLLALFGGFAGVFTGCWAMALAEVLNVFPIFIRRVKLFRCIPYLIASMALGKGIGAWLFFYKGW